MILEKILGFSFNFSGNILKLLNVNLNEDGMYLREFFVKIILFQIFISFVTFIIGYYLNKVFKIKKYNNKKILFIFYPFVSPFLYGLFGGEFKIKTFLYIFILTLVYDFLSFYLYFHIYPKY